MSNLAFLTMPALQIWPCHVTQEANFEKIYFFLILHLILDKAAKILVEKLSTSEVISQKPHGGWKTPPSAFRVKSMILWVSDENWYLGSRPDTNIFASGFLFCMRVAIKNNAFTVFQLDHLCQH